MLFTLSIFYSSGFVGVYIAGHILEATKSWGAVFSQTAVVCIVGWIVYVIFGTGQAIIWETKSRDNKMKWEEKKKKCKT